MAFNDINWGAVVAGAMITTALVAVWPPVGGGILATLGAEYPIGTLLGAAIMGGLAGEFTGDLVNRASSAMPSAAR